MGTDTATQELHDHQGRLIEIGTQVRHTCIHTSQLGCVEKFNGYSAFVRFPMNPGWYGIDSLEVVDD